MKKYVVRIEFSNGDYFETDFYTENEIECMEMSYPTDTYIVEEEDVEDDEDE